MGKDPAILFYTSDFMLGTWLMSFEERGKYITVLAYMHQHGRVSEEAMQKLVGTISANLKSKFKIDENGFWYNERLEAEIIKRTRYTEARRENGKLGGRPKDKPMKGKSHPVNKYDETFQKFWEMYDKPTEKQSCKLKWEKLSESERELIFQKLPAYVNATPERQFRKNPLTYLNRKIWLDEMIPELPKKSAMELLAETGRYE
jgi:uncharacterized protein YdaU (DUF1376 family)